MSVSARELRRNRERIRGKKSVSMLQHLNNQNKSSVMSMQDKSFLPDEMHFFHNIHEMHFNGTHCRTDIYASGIRV